MSFLGMILVFFGILVIAAPLGWIGLNKIQEASDERTLQQRKKRQPKT